MIIISLGSSCDTKNNLKRIGINNPTLFFDYIWNELTGLKDVTNIILNDFNYFNDLSNYTGTINHPILNWDSFNINKYYPNIVFMNYDTSQQCVIDSLNRKIERTKNVLSMTEMKIFIYYRHYNFNNSLDLNLIVEESLEFCKMYKNKYNNNFYILSLITYDVNTDITKINNDMSHVKNYEDNNLKFEFVYRRNDNNQELNNISIKSWDNIFNKYHIHNNKLIIDINDINYRSNHTSIDKRIDIYVDRTNYTKNNNLKILIMGEPSSYLCNVYNYILQNYHKYDLILTHNSNILKKCPNSKKILVGGIWVNQNTNTNKNNRISFLVGGKNFLPGHSLRHEIYKNQTKIKDSIIDVFISNDCPYQSNIFNNNMLPGDKNFLFADYRYHICIENCDDENYFTEKIMDCFQTMTVPIYWGCKNISEFFDIRGMIILNTTNIEQMIEIINSIDYENFYINNLDYIKLNFDKSKQYCSLWTKINEEIEKFILS